MHVQNLVVPRAAAWMRDIVVESTLVAGFRRVITAMPCRMDRQVPEVRSTVIPTVLICTRAGCTRKRWRTAATVRTLVFVPI